MCCYEVQMNMWFVLILSESPSLTVSSPSLLFIEDRMTNVYEEILVISCIACINVIWINAVKCQFWILNEILQFRVEFLKEYASFNGGLVFQLFSINVLLPVQSSPQVTTMQIANPIITVNITAFDHFTHGNWTSGSLFTMV